MKRRPLADAPFRCVPGALCLGERRVDHWPMRPSPNRTDRLDLPTPHLTWQKCDFIPRRGRRRRPLADAPFRFNGNLLECLQPCWTDVPVRAIHHAPRLAVWGQSTMTPGFQNPAWAIHHAPSLGSIHHDPGFPEPCVRAIHHAPRLGSIHHDPGFSEPCLLRGSTPLTRL